MKDTIQHHMLHDTPMVDCGVCGRTHENIMDDCRAFRCCPQCGDCYHRTNYDQHVQTCNGVASLNVTEDSE